MADNDSDYWKRREERMKAEARDAQNKAIAAEKARTDKLATQREMGANEGKAAKAKENAMSWSERKGKEAAREAKRTGELSRAASKDSKDIKNAAKKNAVKEMLAKFKGRGGRAGGPLGGGLLSRQIR